MSVDNLCYAHNSPQRYYFFGEVNEVRAVKEVKEVKEGAFSAEK
jgi:hypothetical protein